jgi:excisionase family DNA binding protein
MAFVSVAEAAHRLGVSASRVHQRIQDGSLPAIRVGRQWAIDEALLHQVSSRPGQPLSRRAAWAVLALAATPPDEELAASEFVRDLKLAPSEWSRARKRLADILGAPAPEDLLRAWLRRRAERRVFRASPPDLADIRGDQRLLLSGLSHPESAMASPDVAEGYLARADLDAFVDRYLLVEAADRRGNVVLHVADRRPEAVWPLLLAADLAEHQQPREAGRARELVEALR